jgi:hypothetical protein
MTPTLSSTAVWIFLLIPQKSVQKKQRFETLFSKKEKTEAVQVGLGRRPILKKGPDTPKNFLLFIFLPHQTILTRNGIYNKIRL